MFFQEGFDFREDFARNSHMVFGKDSQKVSGRVLHKVSRKASIRFLDGSSEDFWGILP